MKSRLLIVPIILGILIFAGTGCTDRVSKKITGIWLIEDIRISGDTSMFDTEQFKAAIEDQKNLRFELKADSNISIYTGASEIDGIWYYDRKSKQVMVTLEGNMQPTVLGSYIDGKLINSDTNALGTVINTIFVKLEPEGDKP